jgi:hypothetical protein
MGGGKAITFQADVTRAADCAAMVEAALDCFGPGRRARRYYRFRPSSTSSASS